MPPAEISPACNPAVEVQPRGFFSRWRRRVRNCKDAAAGFDLGWVKWFACILTLTTVAWPIPNTIVIQIVPWTVMFAGILSAAYFGHILLFRLQCSLLEFLLIIVALGNLEGALLTAPGMFSIGKDWLMLFAPLALTWIFYGAVLGLVQAELRGQRSISARLFHIVAGWLSTGAPALLALGVVLVLKKHDTRFFSKNLIWWGLPLLIMGAAGTGLRIWLGWTARRAAKDLLS